MLNNHTYLLLFTLISLLVFAKSLHETKQKQNPFGLTPFLLPLGIFVWADGVIIGLFWIISSFVAYLLKDSLLFIFLFSLFWLVRSAGEAIYWLNQQFSPINRNPPETLLKHQVFTGDSIWFVYQIFWQCILVVSILSSVYFGFLWLTSRV